MMKLYIAFLIAAGLYATAPAWSQEISANVSPLVMTFSVDNDDAKTMGKSGAKGTPPVGARKQISVAAFDKLLASSMMFDKSSIYAADTLSEDILNQPFSSIRHVDEILIGRNAAIAQAEKLSGLVAPDVVRGKWRDIIVENLRIQAKRMDAGMVAQINAKTAYTPEDVKALKEANSLRNVSRFDELSEEDFAVLRRSKAFMSALTIDFQILAGFREDDSGVDLGVEVMPYSQLMIASIVPSSLAERLGLEWADNIISTGTRRFATLYEFKKFIKASAGKKVTVKIEREGQIRHIEMSVPADLPTPVKPWMLN